jgi:hypothetical protein
MQTDAYYPKPQIQVIQEGVLVDLILIDSLEKVSIRQ